jgi:hypothetical protein
MTKDVQNQNKPSPEKGVPGRKKKKAIRLPINLFDIVVVSVIVLVAILAITGTQLKGLFGIGEKSQSCTVEYMVMFSDVDQELALAISEGAHVYRNETGAQMGLVISDPEVQAHRVVTYVDGSAQMKDKPGSVDITVTVRAEAQYVEGVGYTVGDVVLRMGDTVALRFPGYTGVGSCINISREAN